jgi:hypothetical protein
VSDLAAISGHPLLVRETSMRFEFKERVTLGPALPETVLRNDDLIAGHVIRNRTVPLPDTEIRDDLRDLKLHELTMLSITPFLRKVQHWWHERAEKHYLMCADIEQQRAREAQMNCSYYQKRAALARAARH